MASLLISITSDHIGKYDDSTQKTRLWKELCDGIMRVATGQDANASIVVIPAATPAAGVLTCGTAVATTSCTVLGQAFTAVAGDFTGGGTTQRANKLLATITVSVREVRPGGDLVVAGEQLLTVNQEQHRVSVEGRVRPQDVSSENVVLSTRLADARIAYAGRGDLSSRQKRAWWRTILDWVGF